MSATTVVVFGSLFNLSFNLAAAEPSSGMNVLPVIDSGSDPFATLIVPSPSLPVTLRTSERGLWLR
jgi:hypothetical protein